MSTSSQRRHQASFNQYPNSHIANAWPMTQPTPLLTPAVQQQMVQKARRNSSQFNPVTGPTGVTGQRPATKPQAEPRADLARPYPRVSGIDLRLTSNTAYETGVTKSGHHTSPPGTVHIKRSRHARQGSSTGRMAPPPIMPTSPRSERVTSRSRSRSILDNLGVVRHTTDQTNRVLMSSPTAATQSDVDANLFWTNGRDMGTYLPGNNGIPETRAVHTPYPHDAGGVELSYHQAPPEVTGSGFPTSRAQANEHPLSADISAASRYSPTHSPFATIGSLQQGPASTVADQSASEVNPSSQSRAVDYSYSNPYTQPQDHYEYMSSFHRQGHLLHSPPVSFPPAHIGYDSGGRGAEPFFLTPSSPASPRIASTQFNPYGSFITPVAQSDPTLLDSADKIYAFYQATQPPAHAQSLVASPLHPASPPSDVSSEAERPISPLTNRKLNALRHPGQRVDVDQIFLDESFNDNDDHSRLRRTILDEIQRQPWFINHEKEPQIESRNDPLCRGLGTVGRSIYTVFLVEDRESNQWRCLFGGDSNACKKADKRFERVERAIEHIRSHLGHRPFACDGSCLKSQTTNTPCGKRFFASGYLEDHKKRPQKRTSGSQH